MLPKRTHCAILTISRPLCPPFFNIEKCCNHGLFPISYFGGHGGQSGHRTGGAIMADKEEFTFRAGSVYELPLDKSLNMLQKELCSEYPDLQHKHFSRKMIQCAVRDLLIVEDENSDPKLGADHPMYQHLFRQHVNFENSNRPSDTRAATIDWEVEPLVKAAARARSTKKRLRGNVLIERTFDILVNDISSMPNEDILKDVRTTAILQSDIVKFHLIYGYYPQIMARLNLIWQATLCQPPEISSKNMRYAIPVLDQLLIDLLQEMKPSISAPTIGSSAIEDVYKNLESIRPRCEGNRANDDKVFYFEVNDHSDALKECLNRMPPKASKEELNALKAVYNAYLSEQHSELFKTVQKFKDSYLDIRSYLQKEEPDDALRQKVEGELRQYVCDIFEDINKLESIPYTYSRYTSDHSSGAFITESTKRAHDQIWIALNEPFRLLKLNVFIKGFHVNRLLEGASEESKQDTLAVLRTLYHHIDLELGKLSDSFCELPLMESLSAEPTDEFFDRYTKEVLPVFKDAALNEEKLMDRIHTLQIGGDDIAAFSPAASVLRANAQIVAAHLIHKCATEIMDQYSALESVLVKYEKDSKGSGERS